MGWKPLHPDERNVHEAQRQSPLGRLRRFARHVRYHPWHALKPIAIPLVAAAIAIIVVALSM